MCRRWSGTAAAWAFSIGYIKALYDMTRDERRGPKTVGFRGFLVTSRLSARTALTFNLE
jgi:hypothetical protein